MKVLVNGTSVNIGPDTWPNHLQEKLNCEVVNLSRGHAGNQYIHDSTISEISKRSYNLIIVNWNYFRRINFKTEWFCKPSDQHTLANPHYELLEKTWYFNDTKFEDIDQQELVTTLKDCYEKVAGSNNVLMEATLINIISLQSILKTRNVPYIFTFYGSTDYFERRLPELWGMIDQDCIVDLDLHDIARKNNWWFNNHPTYLAHSAFANAMIEHINTKNLIKL